MGSNMIEKLMREMLKGYINMYFASEEEQRTMLLSKITKYNQQNLTKAKKILCKATFNKNYIEDVIYITNKITELISTKRASWFTEEKFEAICDSSIQINELLDMFDSPTTSKRSLDKKIKEFHQNAYILDIRPKVLSREEFLSSPASPKEFLLKYADCIEPRKRQQETTLREKGYSVAADNPLSNYKRQQLLKKLIENGEVEKGYVIWQIKQYIKDNKNRKNFGMAIAKWEMDLEFVSKL